MYEELIEKFNPLPVFNKKWYDNKDTYSEGEIEDVIIGMIADNEPEDYNEAVLQRYSWSTYYHLTPIRKNILNWYPFKKGCHILEIGCGMGAITNMLCDKAEHVTAVELSEKRATATYLRCRKKDNLEIIVGNLNDIQFEEKYDYITLIGVLEYQGSYTDSDNPYKAFLEKIKKLLKPDGKLLIAIENKYGLKYWCGACEDHTSLPFDGINQYTFTNKKVRTFSRKELEELVNESGFSNSYFYYPMPDYKLPMVVYSDKQLPSNGNMLNMNYYYIPNTSTLVADESKVFGDVIKNGVFDFFANSFLVECSNDTNLGGVEFASMSCLRYNRYNIATIFEKDKVKKMMIEASMPTNHIERMADIEQELVRRGLSVVGSEFTDNVLLMDKINAITVEEYILQLSKEKKIDEIYHVWDMLANNIIASADVIPDESNLFYELNIVDENDGIDFGPILNRAYIDMIPRNAFYIENEFVWFDQEWIFENVPAKFVLYRAAKEIYNSYPELNSAVSFNEIIKRYGMEATIDLYKKLESMFFERVIDKNLLNESRGFAGSPSKSILSNISNLVNK